MGLLAVIATLAAGAAVTLAIAADRGGSSHGDRLVGTNGDDVLKGLAGNDKLFGRGGRDVLIGGPGPDSLHGEGGRDSFNMRDGVTLPAPGRDRIYARDGHPDSINCGAGRDLAVVDQVEDGVYDCEVVTEP
jgi:Ca2+-binding RTX toxin-like protein